MKCGPYLKQYQLVYHLKLVLKNWELNRLLLPCRWRSSLRWKKGSITKLIKGNNGLVRRVSLDIVVSTTNKTRCINRPFQHIIPLELKDIQQSNKNIKIINNNNSEPAIRSDEPRPRTVAAVNADILRRLHKLWCWHVCQHRGECWNSCMFST